MRRLAVRSALSAKQAAEQIRFIDVLSLEQPRTKDMVAFLQAHGIEGKTLIVIPQKDANVQRSASNLPQVKTLLANYLNVIDLLRYDTIVMPREAINILESFLANNAPIKQSSVSDVDAEEDGEA
jgi:large subunit ribosomal protein L4